MKFEGKVGEEEVTLERLGEVVSVRGGCDGRGLRFWFSKSKVVLVVASEVSGLIGILVVASRA